MNARTRYLVIVSLLVLAVGLGTGLVAYYVTSLPADPAVRAGGAGTFVLAGRIVAYADVREVMASELRQKVRRPCRHQENGGGASSRRRPASMSRPTSIASSPVSIRRTPATVRPSGTGACARRVQRGQD